MSPLFPSGHRSLGAALRDLEDDRPKVRLAAIEDLPRHQAQDPTTIADALTRALRRAAEVPEVRAAAALGLADIGAVDRVGDLIAVVTEEAPWQARQMAIAALGELRAEQATDVVGEALRDGQPQVRFQAVMAFPRICRDRGRAVECLVHATEDADPTICHVALRMAEELGPDDSSAPGVVARQVLERAHVLLDHDTALVRVAAAIIVARSGADDGDELLLDVADGRVRTPEAEDEAAAIELCGERSLRGAVAALERRAFGSFLGLRGDPFAWQARVALVALGHPRAVGWVMRGLRSRRRNERTLAVAAAGKARLLGARPELEALRDLPGRVDSEIIADALRALEEPTRPDGADD